MNIGEALRGLLLASLLGSACAVDAAAATTDPPLQMIQLIIGRHNLTAEVAATAEQRATGLMHRFSLRPDHGMIFVFERSEPLNFWMKNTFIPLSIAFIDSDGRILNIDDMAPQTENTHLSNGPARYALEMRKGWFRERNIVAGDRVSGLPQPPRQK